MSIPVVTEDGFCDFLRWLVKTENFNTSIIIDVVEKPHHYRAEFMEYERCLNDEE